MWDTSNYYKVFAVIINESLQSALLHEFCIEGTGEKVVSIKNDFIHESEFPEYIEDTENWIPMSKWIEKLGMINHWSRIKTIRLEAKIRKELSIIENEERVWIYR